MSPKRERSPDRNPLPMWVWLGASVSLHSVALLVALSGGLAMASSNGSSNRVGPGGPPMEFEVAGAADRDAIQGSTEAAPDEVGAPPVAEVAAAPEPEAALPPAPEAGAAPEPVEPHPIVVPRRRRPTQGVTPDANGSAEASADADATAAAARGTEATPAGTDATQTAGGGQGDAREIILGSAGMLGGGAANRALGASGDACTDSVAGVWRAQKFRSEDRSWVRFTLRVEREGDRLTGTILSRIWRGDPLDPTPGECTAFGSDHTWQMRADGHVDGSSLTFDARSVRMIRDDCPASGTAYAPDHFTGHVEGETIHFVNNDGAFDIDEPYTFRRIACE